MAPFAKPETVLKQADGLISVGQHQAALQSLTDLISSKRLRNTPIASLEPIMLRFISLCIDLRKGRTAKEGLMQYKNIVQNTSVGSIEVVIKKFIAMSDAKVVEAQEQVNKVMEAEAGSVDVDDLEASETPESILLGAVSGDQNRDRTDRALVTPWLKFLWEAYRTALETLKNNNRLEGIYQQIVHQAFKFCLKHNRKVEFRRLCETLRLHLSNIAKYAHQTHSVNLSDPDTLQSYLDARFAQLNTSVELELWQEAFRSVEDVHNLLTLAKKAPRPAMMANYYEKLAKIFLMSGSTLFHAAAWGRYYAIIRAIGGKTQEELSKLAGLVLVSALAVPVGVEASDDAPEEMKGRTARLTALLGLGKNPTRVGMLKEALARNTLKMAPEPIRQLYDILEVTFHPLTICSTVAPVLQTLSGDPTYAPYLPVLHKVLLSRLFSQLSQVYESVTIKHVLELVAPLNDNKIQSEDGEGVVVVYDHPHIEAFIMGCAQRGEMRVRVDHAQGSITFGTDGFGSSSSSSTAASSSSTSISPTVYIRTRLSRLASLLNQSLSHLSTLEPPSVADQQAAFESLVIAANEERSRLVLHRNLSARRAELAEELAVRKEKADAQKKLEAKKKAEAEEERRLAELQKRREKERMEKEREAIKIAEAKKLAEALIEKGTLKVDVKSLENVDSDQLLAMQVQQLDKEKRDISDRLRVVSRRIDHTERAFRKDEKALLAEDYAHQQETDKKTYESHRKATLDMAKQQHRENVDAKVRLGRMMDDYRRARTEIAGKREEELKLKRDQAHQKMEAEKAKRRTLVLKQREEEKKANEEEERLKKERAEEEERAGQERLEQEEKARAEQEATRAAEEERNRVEQEARDAARKAREEERAKTVEEARIRLQKEDEALQRRTQAKAGTRPPVSNGTEGSGAWRSSRIASGAATPTAPTTTTPPSGSPRASSPTPRTGGGTPRPVYRPPGGRGADSGASASPIRARSPVRTGSTDGPPKVLVPKAGGWRDRMAAKENAGGGDSSATANGQGSSVSPPPAPQKVVNPPLDPSPKLDTDEQGFKTVPPKTQQAWKPRHLRGE
ncbi:eukaryotic translation initiation factor 3 subunit A [Tulasnella sp. JGI-2019a]|nr:eukaryotic translation initiation factor 3 subunit A [Tulasnella sp. JGI-2019a]